MRCKLSLNLRSILNRSSRETITRDFERCRVDENEPAAEMTLCVQMCQGKTTIADRVWLHTNDCLIRQHHTEPTSSIDFYRTEEVNNNEGKTCEG